jgi:hypothetical protein
MYTKCRLKKLKGKRSLGRPRHRWKNNLEISPKEMGLEVGDWTYLLQERGPVVGNCKHGNEPLGSIEGGEFLR